MKWWNIIKNMIMIWNKMNEMMKCNKEYDNDEMNEYMNEWWWIWMK